MPNTFKPNLAPRRKHPTNNQGSSVQLLGASGQNKSRDCICHRGRVCSGKWLHCQESFAQASWAVIAFRCNTWHEGVLDWILDISYFKAELHTHLRTHVLGHAHLGTDALILLANLFPSGTDPLCIFHSLTCLLEITLGFVGAVGLVTISCLCECQSIAQ